MIGNKRSVDRKKDKEIKIDFICLLILSYLHTDTYVIYK